MRFKVFIWINVFFALLFCNTISFAQKKPHPAEKKLVHHVLKKHIVAKNIKKPVLKKKHLAAKKTKHIAHKKSHHRYIERCDAISPNLGYITETPATTGFFSSVQKHVVDFVHETVSSLNYTSYKMGGTHFDPQNGVYVVDCSGYVDNVLKSSSPHAFSSLVDGTGADKPTSQHYFDFINNLDYEPNAHWNKVEEPSELLPGDILVFRYKKPIRSARGHVMVVMDKPIQQADDTYVVRVADSAPSGHSEDTREGGSGVGIGTLLLKVNPDTGKPLAYAWKMGSCWKRNVDFALARPNEVG